MNTCVVRPFGTAKAKETAPRTFEASRRIVRNRAVAPRLRNRRIAVDAELREARRDDAKESGAVVEAVPHEVVEAIDAVRREPPLDVEQDQPLARLEADEKARRRLGEKHRVGRIEEW